MNLQPHINFWGSLISERYYNDSGYAYLDIDYNNHGNPKTHPEVPHQHEIKIKGNNIRRKKGVKIRKWQKRNYKNILYKAMK